MTEERMTAKELYEAQLRLDAARDTEREVYADLHAELRGETARIEEAPALAEAREKAAALAAEVAAAQTALGGTVYRVAESKLGVLGERVEKLNRRAEKLGVEAITLTELEREEVVRKEQRRPGDLGYLADAELIGPDLVECVYTWVYVAIDGKAPQVPGYAFLAALDHTVSEGLDTEAVTVNRVPTTDGALAGVDLTAYRFAENRCDHCGLLRQRNTTYVVYELETTNTLQVGSTCLRDYTGVNDPHKAARWAEYLATLDADLRIGGDEEEAFGGGGGGHVAIPTLDYLTHVAACSREYGYQPRSRSVNPTADQAHQNIRDYGDRDDRGRDLYVKLTEADTELAEKALEWVRDLGEKDELDEFEHNLVATTAGDYLPRKGDGYVAYVIQAYRRETEKALEREQGAASDYIGEPKARIELSFKVTFVKEFEGTYGSRYLTKGVTPDGNRVLWWATNTLLEVGKHYGGRATVKEHTTDDYNGGARTTVLTRASVSELDPEKAEAQRPAEVRTTAAEATEAKRKRDEAKVAREERATRLAAEEAEQVREERAAEAARGVVDEATGEVHDCLDGPEGCEGKVDWVTTPDRQDFKAFPRCEKHAEERATRAEETMARYPQQQPSDFDPAYAGERWEED